MIREYFADDVKSVWNVIGPEENPGEAYKRKTKQELDKAEQQSPGNGFAENPMIYILYDNIKTMQCTPGNERPIRTMPYSADQKSNK